MPNSEVSKFSILPYTQHKNLENLGKFSFTSTFCIIWNSKSNKWKNDLKEKTLTLWCCLRRKMPISEVSEYSSKRWQIRTTVSQTWWTYQSQRKILTKVYQRITVITAWVKVKFSYKAKEVNDNSKW